MKWFRLYDDIIDDPKILRLSPEFRWNFVGILCISSRQTVRGSLPAVSDIAIHLRITERKAKELIRALIEAGLIDEGPGPEGLRVHGWESRQFKSDNATERWKDWSGRGNKKKTNVGQTLAPTLVQRTRTETDTETEGESPPPPSEISPPESDPEADRVCRLFEEVGGDVAWALWCSRRIKMGDKPAILEAALSEAVNKKIINQSYISKIAVRYAKEGIPKPSSNGKGNHGEVPYRPTPIPPCHVARPYKDDPLVAEHGGAAAVLKIAASKSKERTA